MQKLNNNWSIMQPRVQKEKRRKINDEYFLPLFEGDNHKKIGEFVSFEAWKDFSFVEHWLVIQKFHKMECG